MDLMQMEQSSFQLQRYLSHLESGLYTPECLELPYMCKRSVLSEHFLEAHDYKVLSRDVENYGCDKLDR